MNINQNFNKILKYWWIVVSTTLITVLLLLPWTMSSNYTGQVEIIYSLDTLKDLRNIEFPPEDVDNENYNINSLLLLNTYNDINKSVSRYLDLRLKSVSIQSKIADEADLVLDDFDTISPFYQVSASENYISLNYESSNKEIVENFIQASKEVVLEMVSDWNQTQPDIYKLNLDDSINNSTVVENVQSVQIKAFPVLAGLVIGLFIVWIFPMKTSPKIESYSKTLKTKVTKTKKRVSTKEIKK